MAKLFTISVISWLVALVAFAGTAWRSGRASTHDVVSFGFWGGLAAFTAGAVVFAPVMFRLRHRVQNLWAFIGAGAGLAVVPVVLFAALLDSLGALFSGIAALFFGIFMVFGVCFGAGFYSGYVRRSA
jgi:uncharacterized membrane protein YhhN